MARPSNPRKPEKILTLPPVRADNPALAGQTVVMLANPKGIDRFHASSRVDTEYVAKIRNLMFEDGVLVSRLGTDLMGSNAASTVMQVVDFVRKGQKKVTLRFCLRHLEIFEYGLGAWTSYPIPLTGSERDFFAYTGWADKLLFSNGVDGLWEFDFTTRVAKIVPGAPSAKHLTTFGNRVVASSTVEKGQDYPLRVRWTAKNLYQRWAESTEAAPLTSDLAGGHEDLYGSPGGITDEAIGVFPSDDTRAWLVRSRSVYQMSVSGNVLAPFRFDRVLAGIGSPHRQSIVSVPSGIIFASREDIHLLSEAGHQLIGTLVMSDIKDEVESLNGSFAAYDVGRQEYRIAIDTFVWRYRFVEQGWTADQYPYPIRSLSRQVEGVAGIPIDNLPGEIDGLSAAFPPGAINDLVYDRSFDNAMMFVPESTELTTRENDQPQDTLLTGEETDSQLLLETGVLNLDALKAVELHGIHGEYEAGTDQQLVYEMSQDDGTSWQPYSLKDIEETFGSEMFYTDVKRVGRKIRIRLSSPTLGQFRLLGIAPVLVSVERSMATRKPKPATILILPSTLNLTVGGTQQLSWQVLAANGQPVTGLAVSFVSTNNAIATVTSTGLVRAISPGSFAIVASTRNIQTSVPGMSVAAAPSPVASITITPSISQGAVGTQQQFTATLRDANGNVLLGRTVVWSSSTPGFATIDSAGLATLVAAGTVVISATSEGVTAGVNLTVTASAAVVATVEVAPTTFSGEVGDTVQLVATPKDGSGNALVGKVISWGSNALGVATVNATGLVTLVGAGSVTITATCETVPGTSAGTVVAATVPVATVTVSPSSFSKAVGQTQVLTAVTKDSLGNVLTGRLVVWSSTNTSVVQVDQAGVVTAIAVGTATITATSEGRAGTSGATVTAVPVATVTVSPPSFVINPGASQQLTATLRDASGNILSNRVVSWGSSDVTKATVSSTGLVTGVATGSVTITATSETKFGTASGTIGSVTFSPVNSNSGVTYVPEPHPAGVVAEMPRVFINSRYDAVTSFASTVTLTNSGNRTQNTNSLQAAIDAAAARAGNSKIRLPSPFPCTSPQGRKHAFAGSWTYIEAISLPSAEFTRADAAAMTNSPEFQAQGAGGHSIQFDRGADNYRFVGIKFTSIPNVTTYHLIPCFAKESSVEYDTQLSDVPRKLIFDRCLARGNDDGSGVNNGNVRDGIFLNCIEGAVVDCVVDQIGWTGNESHGIIITNTPGPVKIVNTKIEATGIELFLGGDSPHLGTELGKPTDIEVRRNHFTRRMTWAKSAGTWDGVAGRGIKNIFESKNSRRVLFEGNILENNWADAQTGMAIVIKSGVGNGITAAGNGSQDITIRHNIIRNSTRCWNFAAVPDEADAIPAKATAAYNNLAYDIGAFAGQTDGLALLFLQKFDDLYFAHNTLALNIDPAPAFQMVFPQSPLSARFVCKDNIFGYAYIFSDGGLIGNAAIQAWAAPGYVYERNVTYQITDGSIRAMHPQGTNQFCDHIADVGFVDVPNDDYTLSGSSIFKGDGEGGSDPGADVAKVNTATGGVTSPPSPCSVITHSNPLPISPLTRPAYLASVIDPDLGTKITRVTGEPGVAIPTAGGTWPTVAGHQYAKVQPYSANQRYIFLNRDNTADYGGGFAGLIIDADTFAPVVRRNHIGPEARWHPVVADQMICVLADGSVSWFNPITNVTTPKFVAGGGLYNGATMGNFEGNPDKTGQFVAVTANRIADSKSVAFVVDITAGTKSSDLDLAAEGVTSLDWVSVSQGGGFLVVHGVISAVTQGTKIYDRGTLALISFWNTDPLGHFDLGINPAGQEVAFGAASGGTHAKRFVARRLDTGAILDLTSPISFDWHASTRNINRPGWGYACTNDVTGSYLDDTIYAIKLDGSQVERWCRHRSNGTVGNSAPYACPCLDGKRVFFRSDWKAGSPTSGFVVDVRDICP